jgi:hypothetical protein
MQEVDAKDTNYGDGKVYFYDAKNLPTGKTYRSLVMANDK